MVQMCRWIPAGSAARCVVSGNHVLSRQFPPTQKTVQKFGNRQKDFRRFLQQQQQQPKRIRSNINVHNKRICFVGLVAAAAGNSPPTRSRRRRRRSFGCVIPCIANKDTESKHVRLLFFLSFFLSCFLVGLRVNHHHQQEQ